MATEVAKFDLDTSILGACERHLWGCMESQVRGVVELDLTDVITKRPESGRRFCADTPDPMRARCAALPRGYPGGPFTPPRKCSGKGATVPVRISGPLLEGC